MRSLTTILLSLLLCSFTGSVDTSHQNNTQETSVIICTGKYSKRYHKRICPGMKACKGETKKVSLPKAKKQGLTPCGHCYKK